MKLFNWVNVRELNAVKEQVKQLAAAVGKDVGELKAQVATLQEEVNKYQKLFENSDLRRKNGPRFASSGPVGVVAGIGPELFGEQVSEQLRRSSEMRNQRLMGEAHLTLNVDLNAPPPNREQTADEMRKQITEAMCTISAMGAPEIRVKQDSVAPLPTIEPSLLSQFALESERDLHRRGFLRNAPFKVRTEKTPGLFQRELSIDEMEMQESLMTDQERQDAADLAELTVHTPKE
jgi:hypothetical protein